MVGVHISLGGATKLAEVMGMLRSKLEELQQTFKPMRVETFLLKDDAYKELQEARCLHCSVFVQPSGPRLQQIDTKKAQREANFSSQQDHQDSGSWMVWERIVHIKISALCVFSFY